MRPSFKIQRSKTALLLTTGTRFVCIFCCASIILSLIVRESPTTPAATTVGSSLERWIQGAPTDTAATTTSRFATARNNNDNDNDPVRQELHRLKARVGELERLVRGVTTSKTTKTTTPPVTRIRDDLLYIFRVDGNKVWTSLLTEGRSGALLSSAITVARSRTMSSDGDNEDHRRPVVMEVGMFDAKQCLDAARAGYVAVCLEASPRNAAKIRDRLDKERGIHKEAWMRVHFHHVAAGRERNNATIPFMSMGTTGDHVGTGDMWSMKSSADTTTTGSDKEGDKTPPTIHHVPVVRLDDMVERYGGSVFLLKVDTQGYEPAIFDGLEESLAARKIQFVLTEFWPLGMDFLANEEEAARRLRREKEEEAAGDDGTTQPPPPLLQPCQGGIKMLQALVRNGYTLYTLNNYGHPKAPKEITDIMNNPWLSKRPLDSVEEFCHWFLDPRFVTADYKMGYWTDILAVAPGQLERLGTSSGSSSVTGAARTAVGEVLFQQQQ